MKRENTFIPSLASHVSGKLNDHVLVLAFTLLAPPKTALAS